MTQVRTKLELKHKLYVPFTFTGVFKGTQTDLPDPLLRFLFFSIFLFDLALLSVRLKKLA